MIGGSDSDVRAAWENRIASVAILSGHGDKESIVAVNPDYTVQKISSLYGLLSN